MRYTQLGSSWPTYSTSSLSTSAIYEKPIESDTAIEQPVQDTTTIAVIAATIGILLLLG